MAKYIHNPTVDPITYQGREVPATSFYLIPVSAEVEFAGDSALIADIANGVVKMSRDGSTDIVGSSAIHLAFLNNSLDTPVTVSSSPAFGAKTFISAGVLKKLYARFTGTQHVLTTGSNTLSYTIPYPWVKMIGLEVVNCEALDTVVLKVKDTAAGTYSGVPNLVLNQFSYDLNMPKDYYIKMAQFDADMYQGMVIEITYVSVSGKTIGINYLINEVKS